MKKTRKRHSPEQIVKKLRDAWFGAERWPSLFEDHGRGGCTRYELHGCTALAGPLYLFQPLLNGRVAPLDSSAPYPPDRENVHDSEIIHIVFEPMVRVASEDTATPR